MIQFIEIHFTFPKFRSVLHNTPIHSLPIWLLMILIDDLPCLLTVAMVNFQHSEIRSGPHPDYVLRVK